MTTVETRDATESATPAPELGRRALLAGWPKGTRLGALTLALMVGVGLLAGAPPLAAAEMLVFYLGWVLLPGVTCAALLVREEDELLAAGMALVLGTIALGLFVFVCRATGWFVALYAWPAVTLVFWAALRRRAAPERPASERRGTWLFLAVLALVLVRVPTGIAGVVDGWYMMWKDLVFHGGNVAELLRVGALIDPRTAGRPLNYHLLSHTLPAAASVVTGESISDLFRWWFLGFYPVALTMLVFALARELTESAWAGAVAVLVLALHNDLGVGLFGEDADSALDFGSRLELGVFISPSTCFGLALLAGITLTLLRCAGPERRPGRGPWVQLGLLALASSMTKGSVMPNAIAGGFFAFLVESVRARRWSRRWFAASLVMLLASIPATLYLSLGPGAYAGAMFRFAPWASAFTSNMGLHVLKWMPALETTHPWLGGFALTIPWLIGFLGLGGVGALAWLSAGRPGLGGIEPWILGATLAGLAAGTLLLSVGSSQLFFAYNSQMLLAFPAAAGALTLWRRRRGVAVALLVLALPFVVGGFAGMGRALEERLEVARGGPKLWPAWCEGAAWLRKNTPKDAMLVAHDDALLLTQFAERRVAFADAPYTPEEHALRWRLENGQWRVGRPSEDPWAQLKRASEMALVRGDASWISRLLLATGHTGETYLVRDNLEMPMSIKKLLVSPMPQRMALNNSAVLEFCFHNDAMTIFRVKN